MDKVVGALVVACLLYTSTILMALMVVTMNRLVWRRLYRLAETRYRLDT